MEEHILKDLNEHMKLFCSKAGERASQNLPPSPNMGGVLIQEMSEVYIKFCNESMENSNKKI